MLWSGAVGAPAGLLLYEPFDYPAGTPLHGAGGAEAGFDPGSSWSYSGPQTADVVADGMVFGELQVAGNKGHNASTNGDNEIGLVSRPVDLTVTNGTLWLSYLYQTLAGAVNSGRGLAVYDNAGNRNFAAFGKRNGTSGEGMIEYEDAVQNSGAGLSAATPYLILARFENVGAASGGGSATMWMVAESEFAVFDEDGIITEAELNTIPSARITAVADSDSTPAIGPDGALGLAVIDSSVSTRHEWWFDEVRLGDTLADVVPLKVPAGLPVIDQSPGVTGLATNAATVRATLVSSAAGPAAVTLYWGAADGGTDPLAWGHAIDLGTPAGDPPLEVSAGLTGLSPLTRYHYRFYVANSVGSNWAAESASLVTLSDQPRDPRPNLVIIYADDMGFGDVAAYGALFGTTSAIPTPRMDALAAQGMVFTQAHSSSGVCTPSRYGILTGRYSWRLAGDGVLPSGIVGLYGNPIIRQGELTLGQFLRNQGYATAAFGKWHLGAQFYDRAGNPFTGNQTSISDPSQIDLHRVEEHAVHRGFDHFFGTVETINRPPYAYMRDDKVLFNGTVPAPGTHPWSWLTNLAAESPNGVGDPNIPQIDYSPDMIDEAVSWIGSRAVEPSPFFAYVSLYSPHAPHLPTPAFQGSVGYAYGDFVHETDHWIGRILDALDGHPELQNTIVVLTSDNGPETHAYTSSRTFGHDANGPFRGVKRDSWEGGTRVPFIVRWPGTVAPGRVTGELVWQGDIFATVAAVLGEDLAANEAPDAESFLNILRGQSKPAARRDSIVIASIDNQLSVKTLDGWKLVDGTGGGGNATSYDSSNANISDAHGTIGGSPKQLFHLPTDIGEDSNLQAAQPAKRDELLARLALYRSTPTSGVPPPDNDLDGMPNPFENIHGFDFEDPADGPLDADADDLTNAGEAAAGSHPHDPDSDDDQLGDGVEVNTLGTLPGSPHSDPDTLDDGEEVLIYSTDPLRADTDGDGLDDDDELAAASNPRNAASHPAIPSPVTTALAPSAVQLVGVNGTVNDPLALGATGWPEAGPLHVRERTAAGTLQEYRTRLFLKFDLSGLSNSVESARLRVFQTHRLNDLYTASVEVARVLDPWAAAAGAYPTFDGTAVADAFLFGRNNDFGMAADASGFFSGTPGIPGGDDGGFDPGGRVTALVEGWRSDTNANHGLRIALADRAFAGSAFAAADDPATAALDESLALLVTTRAAAESLDSDDDGLPDAWELHYFPALGTVAATTDDDGDGYCELLELALGSDPDDGASRPSFTLASAGAGLLELRFLRSREAALGYRLEQSSDLDGWAQALGVALPLSPTAIQDLGNGYEEVRYRIGTPAFERLFLRLTVHAP